MIAPAPPLAETGSQQAVAVDGLRLRLIINRASLGWRSHEGSFSLSMSERILPTYYLPTLSGGHTG